MEVFSKRNHKVSYSYVSIYHPHASTSARYTLRNNYYRVLWRGDIFNKNVYFLTRKINLQDVLSINRLIAHGGLRLHPKG